MKAFILYHPQSEWSRIVEEYVRDFEHQRGKKIELVSLETREGSNMAHLYDLTVFPSVVAVRDTGELLAQWQGPKMPLMNEVAAYINQ